MPFARVGFSKGSSPIYNEALTIGMMRKFRYRSDMIGLAVDHGSPPDSDLPNQTAIEAFWCIQIAQGLAITPSVQLLLDTALNPEKDSVWLFGLRIRLHL